MTRESGESMQLNDDLILGRSGRATGVVWTGARGGQGRFYQIQLRVTIAGRIPVRVRFPGGARKEIER
ncbi:MAG: hypothetical protein GC154_12595 [bacterium]|nr:hypothetical protein [bacterium]